MKKLISILLALALLLVFPAASAEANTGDDIPEKVMESVSTAGVIGAKAFMKDPSRGFIGKDYTEEQIDALTLGRSFRLHEFYLVLDQNAETAAESSYAADEWLFFLENKKGPAVYFTAKQEQNGSLSLGATERAAGLSSALSVMEKLAKRDGSQFEPLIVKDVGSFVVVQCFSGGERLITVQAGGELDRAYLRVANYTELPTFAEYRAEIEKEPEEPDATADPDGVTNVDLTPHIDPKRTVRAAAIAGAVLIAAAAAAAIIIKKKRSTRK
ncbi:MAG: hypothetical protein IIT70_02595 [Clostridia bacterium]|nr:hypothetical protein [Clostridia bacterium]MBQ2191465.1 hypothetical protein [Clostridia bacterium]MBQ5487729.1 hypothetical protein [Clostridia bacterium]